MKKKAFITGITGQDGLFLSELLLSKGYKVYGLKRRTSIENTNRINHLLSDIEIIDGDMGDFGSLNRAICSIRPDEIYNLAAQSYVKTSFSQPLLTGDITGLGTARLLESVRLNVPMARYYQASTSELFGLRAPPHNEDTPFYPRSPYGVAKLYAHWITINYRESYGMFACSGILYNHESPFRGAEFVTQKIARGVAAIKLGYANSLSLGNLNAKRDWGHAKDFVRAMWMMLQQEKPEDYVIATGVAHSVGEFAELAFKRVGLDWKQYVKVDQSNMRPAEVDHLCGNPIKAKEKLGWEPQIFFEDIVGEMVDHALENHEEWCFSHKKDFCLGK